jgi:hypothetical protein
MLQVSKRVGALAWLVAAFVAIAFIAGGSGAKAQGATPEVIKQVKLTETQIKGFINSQPDMAKVSEKMQGATSDKIDPAIQAELEAIAKKNGFKDFAEYDDVAANISMVMAGIDPQSGNYADPVASIKKEIEDVTADKTIAEKDKKQMLEELNEALKTTQPVEFPENIELVKKFRAELDKVLQ